MRAIFKCWMLGFKESLSASVLPIGFVGAGFLWRDFSLFCVRPFSLMPGGYSVKRSLDTVVWSFEVRW